MLISLERIGGFSGISKVIEIDSAKLPENKSKKLSILLQTANFFDLPAYIESSSRQRDGFQYILTIDSKGKKNTVTVAESAIPEDLKLLIEWITDNS
ncbi:MAG: protealysin inhibitor emfourin [Rivularia sp. (in: cyanobacteria)]